MDSLKKELMLFLAWNRRIVHEQRENRRKTVAAKGNAETETSGPGKRVFFSWETRKFFTQTLYPPPPLPSPIPPSCPLARLGRLCLALFLVNWSFYLIDFLCFYFILFFFLGGRTTAAEERNDQRDFNRPLLRKILFQFLSKFEILYI